MSQMSAMAAPPIRQHRRTGQQASMPNMIVPTPASEQQQNIDPATKAARPLKAAAKPAFGRQAAGRSPLWLSRPKQGLRNTKWQGMTSEMSA